MAAILISVLVFAGLLAFVSYLGYRFYARPGRVYEQLGGPAALTMPSVERGVDRELNVVVSVVEQLGHLVPINEDDMGVVRRDLIAAGYRSERAVWIYFGIRALSAAGLVILALIFRNTITSNPVLSIVIPIAAGFAGYFGPSFYLDHMVSARQERLRDGLPDALDLIVVSVEAGLGLDQAIQHVSRELMDVHPDISQELELVNLEIRGGKRRVDALRSLADRNDEPELRKLVAVMIQTDRFGTSIADSLRTHSDFMRVRRRQEAEERAAKIGVKLVFPIFFLILPAMLIVVAGPGLLQVFKYLFPMMRQFRAGGV
jgi:tight adherence protein C